MKKRMLQRCFSMLLAAVLTILFIMLFASGSHQSETKKEYTYTVQTGDTLYSIAQDLEIENWEKFRYETCKNNGLEQGGLIFAGQELVIYY